VSADGLTPERAALLVEGRLGRPPQDALEAAVVLEAWGGVPHGGALQIADDVVRGGPTEASAAREERSPLFGAKMKVLVEGTALILAILTVAAWAAPLRASFGDPSLDGALRIALPVTLAAQWFLRSRYLTGDRLGHLRRERIAMVLALAAVLAAPPALLGTEGSLASIFVSFWVSGTLLASQSRFHAYPVLMILAAIAMDAGAAPFAVLLPAAALAWLDVFRSLADVEASATAPAGLTPAGVAALVGGGLGLILVADPTVGLGVRGAMPAIALLPSTLGCFWGGYHLWRLHEDVPRGLQLLPAGRADSASLNGPAMSIFLGALWRMLGATVGLTLSVLALASWAHYPVSALTLFIAFACLGVLTLLIGLLDAVGLRVFALTSVIFALVTEVTIALTGIAESAGVGLIAASAVGSAVALPVVLGVLRRPGRVLATRLWIP